MAILPTTFESGGDAMSYRMNGCLRIEFTFAGYDCEIELDNNGITTVDVDSYHCMEFTSEMTLHELQEYVMSQLTAARAEYNAWRVSRQFLPPA
jgi:hypothetical protein